MSQERLQGSLGLSFHRFICPTDLATIELLLDSRVIYSLSVPEVRAEYLFFNHILKLNDFRSLPLDKDKIYSTIYSSF